MRGVVASLPADMRTIFEKVVGHANPGLLDALCNENEPSAQEREEVLQILSAEFCRCLQPDDEPNDRGRLIDDTLGSFLLRWPLDGNSLAKGDA